MKGNIQSLMMILCLFLSCPAAAGEIDGQDPVQARRAMENGNLEQAILLYERLLQSDPENMEALLNSGYLLYKAMYYKRAGERFKEALEINGKSFYPLFMLGNVALQEFRPLDALSWYEKALELKPEDVETRDNILLARERVKRAEVLARHYDRSGRFCIGEISLMAVIFLIIVWKEISSNRAKN